jgi:hypothetical protein
VCYGIDLETGMANETLTSAPSPEDAAQIVDLLAQILAELRALNANVTELGERLAAH